MTKSRSTLAALCLGLALTSPALAKTDPIQEPLATLQKALTALSTKPGAGSPATPPNPILANAARWTGEVEAQINQKRFTEAEQVLISVRQAIPTDNVKAYDAIEQLLTIIHARAAEAAAKQAAAYAALEQEFVTKFNSKAPAAAYDALLQQITALVPTGGNNYGNPAAQKLDMLRTFVSRWQDYLLQTAAGNNQLAYQTINDLTQQAARLPVVPRSQLAGMAAEAATRANTSNPQLEALRQKLPAIIDGAKSAADFDAILAELPRATNGYPNSQVEQARRIIVRWQDYYSQLDSGASQSTQNLLREIANDPNIELYYPRSKILARINGLPLPAAPRTKPADNPDATDPLIPPEKLTLATLGQFVRQLAARPSALPAGAEDLFPEALRLRTAAQQLEAGNSHAAQAGLNTPPNSNLSRWGVYADALFTLRQQLQTKNFALLIEAPETLQPADGEGFEKYVARVWQYGRAQKDWTLIYRMLALSIGSVRVGTNAESSDLSAYTYFFAGLQLEKAGSWTSAVRAYFNALRANSLKLPPEEVGVRLAAIKADHPAEYTEAEKNNSGENLLRNLSFGPDSRSTLPLPPPKPGPATPPPSK